MSSPQLPLQPHKYEEMLYKNWQSVQYPVLSEVDRVLSQENPRSVWLSVVSDVETHLIVYHVYVYKHQNSDFEHSAVC